VPYADPDAQREYQRVWLARRRDEWFSANGPCSECGSWENLELHHLDPTQKVSHRVWSWSLARRTAELAKCTSLCRTCHDRHDKGPDDPVRGEEMWSSVLTEAKVLEIKGRLKQGERGVDLAREFGVSRQIVGHIKTGYRWSWL
jgi:hypothetical protein